MGENLSTDQAYQILEDWTKTLLNHAKAGDIGGLKDDLVEVNGAVAIVEAAVRRSREPDDRCTCSTEVA